VSRRILPPTRLGLVQLEDRTAPAVFTVTTVLDNGNNVSPTPGSLREAILKANLNPGADDIIFAIPGAGVQVITPPTPLPPITDTVTINGATQTGYAGTPVIRLSGSAAGVDANGLVLLNHTGSTIKALSIGGFNGSGILISGGGSHRVVSSFIGTTQNGTAAAPNGIGILIGGESKQNIIGGPLEGDRNIISGNAGSGVEILSGANNNTVLGNFIGTDQNGVNAVANQGVGVALLAGAVNNTVGGTSPGAGNVIAGNGQSGVLIADPETAGNLVAGNRIGLNFAGLPLGNGGDGVLAKNAAGTAPVGGTAVAFGTTIKANTIAQNKGNGIAVRDTTRLVRLEGNSIFENAQRGIVVDPTANDGLQPPIISSITPIDLNIRVVGTITGRPQTQYTVSLFNNSSAVGPAGAQAQFPIGTVQVVTDAGGSAKFQFEGSPGAGRFVTATTTATTAGDTSALSEPVLVPGGELNSRLFAAGAGAGGSPQVVVYRGKDGVELYRTTAFNPSFTGGVRVAMADFNGDGTPELIVGTGPGTVTQVKVLSGVDQTQVLFSIQPFESSFTGGVYVSAGDVNGDGVPDLIISPDEGGGPRVRVFDGATFTPIIDFFGIEDPNFRGGARTAVGDIDGNGFGDLIVAAGFGGGPRVAGYKGESLATGKPVKVFADFFAFEQTLRNGVFIAAADVNGDGFADLIAGGGPGGGPRVTIFQGVNLKTDSTLVMMANFFAGDETNRGGVRLAARDLDGDGRADVITGPGPAGGSLVKVYNGLSLSTGVPGLAGDLEPFPGFGGGVYVG
jgi:hypothetical protein